jgi:phosphatidylethanolamine/phosphatidyl-N-methylethanolamine N-methyltransferase
MKDEQTKRKYRWLSFIYDRTVKTRWFEEPRKREFELARIQAHQQVLVIGIGTGLDIPYLPKTAKVTGIDISPEMLAVAKQKSEHHDITLLEMSAEHLDFEDEFFDVIIMNLILSVVTDPKQTLREAARVLKPSGSIWLLHKDNDASKVSTLRRRLNKITTTIGGADITRSVAGLINDLPLQKRYKESFLVANIIQLKHK